MRKCQIPAGLLHFAAFGFFQEGQGFHGLTGFQQANAVPIIETAVSRFVFYLLLENGQGFFVASLLKPHLGLTERLSAQTHGEGK